MKKFILDTNVILADPKCIYKFEDNEVYIPLIVIEELDRNKKGQSEKARAARQFSRSVDAMRADGDLAKGVDLPTGGKLYITTVKKGEVPLGMDLSINDDLILYTAKVLDGIVVSKDLNVRLKADALGIPAEDYKAGKLVLSKDLDSGHSTIRLSDEQLESFRVNGFIEYSEGVYPNEYYIMLSENNDKNSALGRFSPRAGGIVKLISANNVWGIRAKNAEQRFAVDALLNDEISLVSLVGKAGTGKTLLAVACGLQKTLEEKKYQRMLISRPVIPMGKDIGYLPGDINEKLNPWMSPIFDNLDFLFGGHGGFNNQWKPLVEQGIIKIEALTYIRGRSIPSQYMIVDEAQNLSPHEVKTIVTRIGEGTKLVFTGDPEQIDSAYLDQVNNGLTYVIDRMKTEDIVSHIELLKGERSKLAEIATKLM